MLHYTDKRPRYAGVPQWEMTPGTPRADNRTKTEAKTTSAVRVPDTYEQNEKGEFKLIEGNKTPRDNFRVTTAPKSLQAGPVVSLKANSVVPTNGTIHLPNESKALNAATDASPSETLR